MVAATVSPANEAAMIHSGTFSITTTTHGHEMQLRGCVFACVCVCVCVCVSVCVCSCLIFLLKKSLQQASLLALLQATSVLVEWQDKVVFCSLGMPKPLDRQKHSPVCVCVWVCGCVHACVCVLAGLHSVSSNLTFFSFWLFHGATDCGCVCVCVCVCARVKNLFHVFLHRCLMFLSLSFW